PSVRNFCPTRVSHSLSGTHLGRWSLASRDNPKAYGTGAACAGVELPKESWMKITDPFGIASGRMVKVYTGVVSGGIPLTGVDCDCGLGPGPVSDTMTDCAVAAGTMADSGARYWQAGPVTSWPSTFSVTRGVYRTIAGTPSCRSARWSPAGSRSWLMVMVTVRSWLTWTVHAAVTILKGSAIVCEV